MITQQGGAEDSSVIIVAINLASSQQGVSLDIESIATLIFDDIIGLLKSIRRLNGILFPRLDEFRT